MKFGAWVAALVGVAGVGGLLFTGCGIATAPVSLPGAVAQNANYSLKGPVVDLEGRPLDGVLVSLRSEHHVWTPIAGGHDNNSAVTRRVDGKYEFDARGTFFELKFARDGYGDRTVRLERERPGEVIAENGAWPNVNPFPLVMVKKGVKEPQLRTWSGTISYEEYPTADVIDLGRLGDTPNWREPRVTGKHVENANTFRPGTLYVTLEKEAPRAIDAKGTIDATEIGLPSKVTLHVSGAENGLVRMEPRVGYHPLIVSDVAPASGYVGEWTISRARLKEMRAAKQERIMEAREYFFFKANGKFGKGVVKWSDANGTKTGLWFQVWENPEATDRDLATHEVK